MLVIALEPIIWPPRKNSQGLFECSMQPFAEFDIEGGCLPSVGEEIILNGKNYTVLKIFNKDTNKPGLLLGPKGN